MPTKNLDNVPELRSSLLVSQGSTNVRKTNQAIPRPPRWSNREVYQKSWAGTDPTNMDTHRKRNVLMLVKFDNLT